MEESIELEMCSDMDGYEKFEFDIEPFSYSIEYYGKDNIINIVARHCEEFYSWNITISESLSSTERTCNNSNSSSLNFTIDPELLFILLKEFYNDTLNPMHEFKFPNDYKSPDVNLPIEIVTRLPYKKVEDIKMIYLKPINTTEAERFDYKLRNVKKMIESNYVEQIRALEDKISTLEKFINNKLEEKDLDEIRNKINKLVTQKQLTNNYVNNSQLVTYATKNDIKNFVNTTDLNHYATKTDLNNYASKIELINYATKTDLYNLENIFEKK